MKTKLEFHGSVAYIILPYYSLRIRFATYHAKYGQSGYYIEIHDSGHKNKYRINSMVNSKCEKFNRTAIYTENEAKRYIRQLYDML